LQTHSPSQYIAAFAASSSFCAFVFLVPKTFSLVLVVAAGANDAVVGAVIAGGVTKADVVENNMQTNTSRADTKEEKDFMVYYSMRSVGVDVEMCVRMNIIGGSLLSDQMSLSALEV
jgi:hypothetical protein